MNDRREAFYGLVDRATRCLSGGEVLLASYAAEESDFVRFNRARVRQAMTIRQAYLTLSVVSGLRRDTTTVGLSGNAGEDAARVDAVVAALRASLASVPEDPYLLYSEEPSTSDRVAPGALPRREEALATILEAASGADLVGLYASGPVSRGFASSLGHRHFHEVASFQFEWSLYHSTDKAVNRSFATSSWSASELAARIAASRAELEYLKLPPRSIEPGAYRTYLSPTAVAEFVGMLNWGGVSSKAQRTKTSCLQRLSDGEERLSALVTLRENTTDGLSPAFDEVGFTKPPSVGLVVKGEHAGAMVSPRTAREYGIASNGADADEGLRSADLSAGSLPTGDVLAALDTGIYVGNLWYLNFSDRVGARITGMTRFATFWVEKGRIVAPLNVMRFDDSLYRVFGDHLVDLTVERDWILSSNTYGQRSVESVRLPGALVRDMRFVL